ncbi:glutathione S-transferase family protein [Celerinatantimonas diazotrophica]|uniref:Glutathione S-transferase n=1 Tax=Celerinatantimonas diazotrophica TaxID=412034 RepID=A0A4R1JLB0_9GAMM|nr:glutathione S-transferase family protein [Celerinatantimonas diazotrophica]TCK51835.1 glutathione S-transferase [Celerinatantimonas diazotrophica]CAG9296473.1 Glutathione S-transferase GstB [Celerinatantimonas diazotrophica]
MKLYGRATSFNVQKVLWLLEELHLSYEHIEIGGKFGGLDSPEFARINPMKKVPVLVDDDKVIWESHTILRYLVASYGKNSWYKESPYERSLYERWMDWSHLIFQPAFMGTFWGYYRTPESKRDINQIETDLNKCFDCLNQLEAALADKNYLLGGEISLADVCSGAILYRLTSQGLTVPLPENVRCWFDRLKARSAYQKSIMSDFSELKAREAY